MTTVRYECWLDGIDGGNMLGFMAALGTLRTASRLWPDGAASLRWGTREGTWRPHLSVTGPEGKEAFLDGLNARLKEMDGHIAFAVGDDLNFTAEEFRRLAVAAQDAIEADPTAAAFIGAFANEAIYDEKREFLADTAFRTMRGSGHQHFVQTMRELVKKTGKNHLEASLFQQWRYVDKKLSLRWDPQDDRRYALRWKNPSKDESRTERGAHRLAIEALPLFCVQPVGKRLETTGFSGCVLTWPLWEEDLVIDLARSLMSLPVLQSERPDKRETSARGISAIYRCQRITIDKFRNFSNSEPI